MQHMMLWRVCDFQLTVSCDMLDAEAGFLQLP